MTIFGAMGKYRTTWGTRPSRREGAAHIDGPPPWRHLVVSSCLVGGAWEGTMVFSALIAGLIGALCACVLDVCGVKSLPDWMGPPALGLFCSVWGSSWGYLGGHATGRRLCSLLPGRRGEGRSSRGGIDADVQGWTVSRIAFGWSVGGGVGGVVGGLLAGAVALSSPSADALPLAPVCFSLVLGWFIGGGTTASQVRGLNPGMPDSVARSLSLSWPVAVSLAPLFGIACGWIAFDSTSEDFMGAICFGLFLAPFVGGFVGTWWSLSALWKLGPNGEEAVRCQSPQKPTSTPVAESSYPHQALCRKAIAAVFVVLGGVFLASVLVDSSVKGRSSDDDGSGSSLAQKEPPRAGKTEAAQPPEDARLPDEPTPPPAIPPVAIVDGRHTPNTPVEQTVTPPEGQNEHPVSRVAGDAETASAEPPVQGPTTITGHTYKGSYALVIGVSDYTAGWTDLETVPSEVAAVARVLEDRGFKVVRVLDPDAEGLKGAFSRFLAKYGHDVDNRLLVFFSGHGHSRMVEQARKLRSKGYLVPADAPRPDHDEQGFLSKAYDMVDVLSWCRKVHARHAMLLFDSCFSGAILEIDGRGQPSDAPETPPGTANLPVRYFITSGQAHERVPGVSQFAPCFVAALEGAGDLDGNGYIDGHEIGCFISTRLHHYGTRQVPVFDKMRDPTYGQGEFRIEVPRRHTPPEAKDIADLQERLRREGLYEGQIDGVLGPGTWSGLQGGLKRMGYYRGDVDGVDGVRTYQALELFQTARGIPPRPA
ncbi:MAG: hypothetical protein HON70_13350, partial [Lentisphaerae bacterium]|nr:hypothetical protein [Lentisphaerota bacterium]